MPNMTTAQYLQWLSKGHECTAEEDARSNSGPDYESDLHDQITDYCHTKGWLAVHSRMDKPTTYAAGTSDFIIVTPKAVLFIECKRKGVKMTTEQLAFRAHILKLGWPHAVVHNMTEFSDFLKTCNAL